MAVHDCINQNLFDNGDDDDGPAFFKRSSTASKHDQLNSALKKSVSQRHDGSSGRDASNSGAPDVQTSKLQKGKLILHAKVPSERSTMLSPGTSTSTLDRSKYSSEQKSAIDGMKKKPSNASPDELNVDSDDSDDDKPLSSRMVVASTAVQKKNSSHVLKEINSPTPTSSHSEKTKLCFKKSDDSDDDKPLTSRMGVASMTVQKNKSFHVLKELCSPTPTSSHSGKTKLCFEKSPDDSEDEKPLSSKFQLKSGGSASTKKLPDSFEKKPLPTKFTKSLNKRPLDEVNSSVPSLVKKAKPSDPSLPLKVKQESRLKEELTMVQSSVKKAKPSDASLPLKVKQESRLKEESDMDDDDDHVPISQRMKKTVLSDNKSSTKKVTKVVSSSFKKATKKSKKVTKNSKYSKSIKGGPPGSGEGQKWTTLEHSGVIFPPPYKPHGVKMLYNGQPVDLTPEQEEVATMFAVMKDTEYATKQRFIDNFMNDWRVILGRNHVIKKFELCDFTPIYEWHQNEKEKKKQMSTEEKKAVKDEKLKQEEKYMWAIVDGVKEKVGNFRVEPPGLFRGRGEHPKMGKLKRRIHPSDITINIGRKVPVPECPIPGQRWKEVKHDNTVTWLAFWNDPINPKEFKYVFLAASSSLKGQSDKEKYEKARLLKDYIHGIRATYTKDFMTKDVTKRQIAVATYLIDKLALRAGNEKDDDEADTVGCCTLKVENVTLLPPNKLQFDFLGKDSIRYFNTVEVELPVYKAIGQFRTGKKDGDDLFDQLDTSKLNAHLKELMPGLTAKVFRTYNASFTLDELLNKETKDGNLAEKAAVYQRANKEVAIICNHQRSVSKSHGAQMSRLSEKMDELKGVLEELKVDLSRAKKGKPPLKDADGKTKKNLAPEVLEKKIAQTNAKIEKMELDMKIKEDLKTVALGTSKINYCDPRITVSWCKRHEVPIEKIFNKSLLAKFAWAMDVDPSFRF
ncbi:DNA topoisomerase 1 alpha-like [Tasmannia lanceolata]|uniref:DNA topoisomerase 1 alpha-like n=1 Tax=Tasmannia lanceolata TaxID=3420 RepID=UPI0040631254